MATIDDLTPVLASAVANTDVMYVGLPLNADPDRQILISEAKELFLPDNGVTNLKLRDSAALSVIGRAGNTTGDPADIAAATDGHVLRRSGTALGFGTISAGVIANGLVSDSEFQYLDGVTSGIQGQLNAKQATVTGAASTITSTNLTPSRALASDASGKIVVSAVTSVELGYLDGVTSGVQAQLNGKASTATTFTAGAGLVGGGSLAANRTIFVDTTLGAIGTTALLRWTGTGQVTPGTSTSGSNLYYSTAGGAGSGGALTGTTWRCLGYVISGTGNFTDLVSLFVRTA